MAFARLSFESALNLELRFHSAASSLSGGSFEELAQLWSSASRAFVHQKGEEQRRDHHLRVMQAVTTLNGLMKDIMKLKEAYKGRVKKLKSVWKKGVLDLRKKNDKLKRKLEQEKKNFKMMWCSLYCHGH
ncbi:hypothetical protein LR48_Vigan10g196800 [Vigna angularis]|uniref:Uncharacterized protein n=1 Tax=Phaseolus angularis TaxID=3914 RepID=A0A0L9VLZ3_PHAAN|nr:hypothetical protein LR48_Vigan10g196800 [Vigna angularis]